MAAVGRKAARVVVCGLGRMGQIRTKQLATHPRFELVAVADSSFSLATETAQQLGCKPFAHLGDAMTMMGPKIDAVVLCTPTYSHLEMIEIATSQRKDVMTEKPVCEGVEDIREAFDAARRRKTNLFCSFQRRFDPSYTTAKEAVQNGHIGTPQLINVAFRDHPVPPISFLATGGDPFTDLMPHDVDFVRDTLKEDPCEVYAMGSAFHHELKAVDVLDTAMCMLKFPSGAMCKIDMSRSSAYGYDQRCEIFGSEGMVEVGNPQHHTMSHANSSGFTSSVLPYSFPQRFDAAYNAEIDHFAEVVLDGVKPQVTEDDCVAAQNIAQAALQSYKEGVAIKL